MNRVTRLIPFAVLLALVSAFAWTPAAEAVGYCSATYCANQPPTKLCGCPPHTDRPGATAFCGNWNTVGACWYGSAAAASTSINDTELLATLAGGSDAADVEAPASSLQP